MITVALVVVIAILGFSLFQSGASTNEPTLSSTEIRQLVQEQYPPGTITSLEYEENANDTAYKVELDSDGNLYTIRLNGNTGEVLDLKVKETVTNHAQGNDDENKQTEPETNEGQSQSKESEQEESADESKTSDQKEDTSAEGSASNAMISTEKAKEIALAEFSGTVVELELDEDDGLHIYEVEIENGEDEATIEIDAHTGEILMLELDIEDDDN